MAVDTVWDRLARSHTASTGGTIVIISCIEVWDSIVSSVISRRTCVSVPSADRPCALLHVEGRAYTLLTNHVSKLLAAVKPKAAVVAAARVEAPRAEAPRFVEPPRAAEPAKVEAAKTEAAAEGACNNFRLIAPRLSWSDCIPVVLQEHTNGIPSEMVSWHVRQK